MTSAPVMLSVVRRVERSWLLVLLLAVCQIASAATNPDPCPSDQDCSSWVCVAPAELTCTYESGPYTVCPSTSTASWSIAQGMSQGHRTFTVPGREECNKEHYFGLKNIKWTWTITGPGAFAAQSGDGVTATLNNQRPSIPGHYVVAWVGTADFDDACCTGSTSKTYYWGFDIPAPSGTAVAEPAEQTVCLHPDMTVEDLLGDGDREIPKVITFTFTPTADGCTHNIRWQLSAPPQLGLQAPLSGTGTTATASLRIPINNPSGVHTVSCVFSSEDTGADLATATAQVTLVNAAWKRVEPTLTLTPKPARSIQACLVYAGDLDPGAQTADGKDDLVCPDGQVIRTEPITHLATTYLWTGLGGVGMGATQHVIANGPGNYSSTCRVFALFWGAKSGLVLKRNSATWSIKVNKVELLLKPKLVWRDGPRLDPNPAAPGDLVSVIATAESIAGKKICRPNPTAPIAVTPAVVRFELPPAQDPLNPDIWVEGGKIRVGPNAIGSFPIKVIAEAHIIDPADIALCGGDLQPLERTVTLQVPAPKAKIVLDDVLASPNSVVTLPWILTNTGRVRDAYSFSFTASPTYSASAPADFGLEVVGWSFEVLGVADSEQHSLGTSGSVTLERGESARGSVTVRVWNGHWGNTGNIALNVKARNKGVASATGKVQLPTLKIKVIDSSVAAGGLGSIPHQTNVVFYWAESATFSSSVDVKLDGGLGSDNSKVWWWGMGAVPAQLAFTINGQPVVIKAGETKAIPIEGRSLGILTSSNKIESTSIQVKGIDGKNIDFVSGQYQVTVMHANDMPLNAWENVYVSKTLRGKRITGHLVRLVVYSVTLSDGRTLTANLGSDVSSSSALTNYVLVDENAIYNHSYEQHVLDANNPGTVFRAMITNPLVTDVTFSAYDFNVEAK